MAEGLKSLKIVEKKPTRNPLMQYARVDWTAGSFFVTSGLNLFIVILNFEWANSMKQWEKLAVLTLF